MDGFTLYAVVTELKEKLIGAKIDKVMMPTRDEVNLLLRSFRESFRLVICVNSADFRLHLTEHPREYPLVPPSICMYLRKYLTGSVIRDISMQGLERVVRFTLDARSEMGDKRILYVYVELMAKHSNLIITDEAGKILECFRHISVSDTAVRPMLPGLMYTPISTQKLDPLSVSEEQLAALLCDGSIKTYAEKLSAGLQGLSVKSAAALIELVFPDFRQSVTGDDSSRLAALLYAFFNSFAAGGWQPHITAGTFSVFPYPLRQRCFESVNGMMDAYWRDRLVSSELANKKRGLLKQVKHQIDKKEKKLKIQLDVLVEAGDADKWRIYADLITANLNVLRKNVKTATVQNYYDELRPVDIPLDERYSPAINAQRYYKKYSKLKTAAQLNAVYVQETERELEFLRDMEFSLNTCDSMAVLKELEGDMVFYGLLPQKADKRKKKEDAPSQPLHFRSSEGLDIYVGRNSRQNDMLTLRQAAPDDLWLHAKGPGSHVILKLQSADIPDVSLLEAAALAAYYSGQRGSDKATVDYTFRRNIKKPSGARSGKVIYDTYFTVNVPSG